MKKQIFKQSVGIDISKDSFNTCFSQQEAGQPFRVLSSKKFDSNAKGFRQMHQWIQKYRCESVELHLLMEATGVYYEDLAYFLHKNNYRLTVILPNKTHAFAKSLDYKSKTDKIDAKMLAQLSLERNLRQWEPPSDTMLVLKRLCRERAELKVASGEFKNRLHAKNHSYAPHTTGTTRTKATIKHFEKQVKEIEALIRQTVAKDPEVARKVDQVCTIPGVGFITAVTVIAETNGFELFKNKAQLVSYAGLDVVHFESGSSVHAPGRISKRGNSTLRRSMFFPAITAVKHNPKMADIYNKLLERTQIKMKAYVAVQRKILVLIYTLYKNDSIFDANFISQKN